MFEFIWWRTKDTLEQKIAKNLALLTERRWIAGDGKVIANQWCQGSRIDEWLTIPQLLVELEIIPAVKHVETHFINTVHIDNNDNGGYKQAFIKTDHIDTVRLNNAALAALKAKSGARHFT